VRVLAVDPGLTRCGIGVVDADGGRRVALVDVGVVRTSPTLPVERRLLDVTDSIETWLADVRPDAVAVERVFAQENLRTVIGTSQVAGLVMVAAARRKIPVGLHTPSEVKAAVTGYGRAGKAQVQEMVARILGLADRPHPADAADALALAICHAWRPTQVVLEPRRGTRDGDGGTRSRGHPLTAAQAAWVRAEQAARRRG
jgi:crossover junction endodeoxyribonuclease RuvC